MRRTAMLLISAAGLLAACNPSAPGGAGGADGGGSVFPNLFQTAYRAEATTTNPSNGQTMPVVMIRDGQRMRMEMSTPQGPMVVVMNHETGESFMVAQMGGRPMVIRQTNVNAPTAPEQAWGSELAESATAVGPCMHAGETGTEWRRADDGDSACITGDGIILWGTDGGERTWETTSVQRGPQNPSLFAVPDNAQTMDLNNMMGPEMMDALEKAKAGR